MSLFGCGGEMVIKRMPHRSSLLSNSGSKVKTTSITALSMMNNNATPHRNTPFISPLSLMIATLFYET
jgi:hypothetical protein